MVTTIPSRHSQRGMPQGKTDAETRPSVIGGRHGRNVQWRWYLGCIRQMLKDAGCAESDLDDIAHDFIVDKLDRVFQQYDRTQGRFRAYLYRSVVNAWRDRLRSNHAKDSRHLRIGSADLDLRESPKKDSQAEDLRVLNLFFDRIFSGFMREMTKTQLGFFLLRDWCLSGRDIDEAVAVNRLEVSPEYARKIRAEAIKSFATFVEGQLSAEDFALMAMEAKRRGDEFGIVANAKSIAGVFRWPSEKKRLGTVALLLRHLYLKYQRQGDSFDNL